jgi:hypothetical protein
VRRRVADDVAAVFGERFLAEDAAPDPGVVDATLARSRELAAATAAWAAEGEGGEEEEEEEE